MKIIVEHEEVQYTLGYTKSQAVITPFQESS